jgi:Ser/Thr protein kinase RdoA (MazF antagonist)
MAEWYQKLLEFAAKEYDFDINTFKTKEVSKFNDPSIEIFTFNKSGKEYIIDFYPAYLPQRRQTRAELNFINYLAENSISVARPLKTVNGELFIAPQKIGEDFNIIVFEMASGEFWDKNDPKKWNDKIFFNWGKLMGNMHRLAKDYKYANTYNVPDIFNRNYTGWGSFFDCLKIYPKVYKITQELLDEIMDLPRNKDSYGLIHCDLHPYNFLIDGDKITVFDFDDNIYAWFALDIGIGLYHGLDWSRKDDFSNDYTNAIIRNFLKGYLSANDLSDFWISKIPMFMKYRQIWFNTEIINDNQKNWIYNIENDILFDGYDLKSIADIIERVKV